MFPRRRRRRRHSLLLLVLLAAASLWLLRGDRLANAPGSPRGHEGTIETALAHHGFVRGISAFQPDGLSKHLVLPCTPHDDVAWLATLPAWLNATPKVYHVPLAGAAPAPGVLRVPQNKGNEAMAYLTYLVDHYERLPDLVLFTHASAASWHNNNLHVYSTPLMLRELNYARVVRRGFVNLRCNWTPGCPDWIHPGSARADDDFKAEEGLLADAFGEMFAGVAPAPAVPRVVGAPCCAQFAVSRARIRARPRTHYEGIRAWLLRTPLASRHSGRVLEYLWHYIFAGSAGANATESIDCPAEHVCYCDGYGVCFGGEPALRTHLTRGRETAELELRLQKAVSDGPRPGEQLAWRDAGMRALRLRIEAAKTQLAAEIDGARLRGRDAQVRRREVGDAEFSG